MEKIGMKFLKDTLLDGQAGKIYEIFKPLN
jgi:hypothetical protein